MSAQNNLIPKIRELIEQKYGKEIEYTYECQALAQSMSDTMGESVSLTTLKRLFGFVKNPHIARRSTLDIIARYLGYRDYAVLAKDLGEDTQISDFEPIEAIEVEDLEPGDTILVKYEPNRELIIEFEGNGIFMVRKSLGSKLMDGDRLKISQLAKGFELAAYDVIRNGESLGSYVGAKQGGITGLELI